MSDNIEERVRNLVAQQLGVPAANVKPESSIVEDLGADSLDIVELVMRIEEEFGFEIPDSQTEKIRTVGDAINYLRTRQA